MRCYPRYSREKNDASAVVGPRKGKGGWLTDACMKQPSSRFFCLSQIMTWYNDFRQISTEFIAHDGMVNTSTTPKIQYSYADGSSNQTRPTSVTYPDGRQIDFDYGTSGGIDDSLSRVQQMLDGATTLVEYRYLGAGTPVQISYPQPDVTMDLWDETEETYAGLDRFGRVKDVRWRDLSAGIDLSRIEYGYDRASNRTWRENLSDPNREHDWLYAYDGLHRLSSAERGQLNSGHTAITGDQFNQCWSLDPTGNWKGFQQDDNADGTADLIQTRTANAVNEITGITNTTGATWATPTYDLNGNTTTNPRPDLGTNATMTATFDAWNRLRKLVDDATSATLLENTFDGRNFRITATEGANPTRHYYFTDDWQCVEERTGTATTPERQHVWGIRYIDDLLLREPSHRHLNHAQRAPLPPCRRQLEHHCNRQRQRQRPRALRIHPLRCHHVLRPRLHSAIRQQLRHPLHLHQPRMDTGRGLVLLPQPLVRRDAGAV